MFCTVFSSVKSVQRSTTIMSFCFKVTSKFKGFPTTNAVHHTSTIFRENEKLIQLYFNSFHYFGALVSETFVKKRLDALSSSPSYQYSQNITW